VERELDFGIPMLPEQWEELGRTAAALGPARRGFAWDEGRPGEIRVYLRHEDAPPGWLNLVTETEAGTYGAHERAVARFFFHDGRPFGRIALPNWVAEPAYQPEEAAALWLELERWVRGKWHELLRAAGVHYERGHIPGE